MSDETWWDQATRFEQHWRNIHIKRIEHAIRTEHDTYGQLSPEVIRGLRLAIDALNTNDA